ncbi:MAG TPA: hypothetical protein VD993_07855 [Chitinophagaceae bacterium]|nr:hypothetical protein [Chitinophagaceae bacterium]
MARIALLLLIIIAACEAKPQATDRHILSMILVRDSMIVYNGDVNASRVVRRLHADEQSIRRLLNDNKKRYGNELNVVLKPADNGGGGAMMAVETFMLVCRLAEELNIKLEPAKLNEAEHKRFNLVSLERGTREPLQLFLPKDGDFEELKYVDPKRTLTLILTTDTVLYYTGTLATKQEARPVPYEGIRKVILSYKQSIGDSIIVMIKPTAAADYKFVVNMLDEMTINDIKYYALRDLKPEEIKLLDLQPFEPVTAPVEGLVVETPTVVETKIQDMPTDVSFYLEPENGLLYSLNKDSRDKAKKIHPVTTANIVRVIEEIARKQGKKTEKLLVVVYGDNNARYEQFKVLMEALKQQNVFNFKMVSK